MCSRASGCLSRFTWKSRTLDEGNKQVGLKAQTHFWGYSLKLPTRDSENVSVKVDDAEDKSDDSQDVSPLQASREWVAQAENNVLDRLEQAGLVAPLTQNGYETHGTRPDCDEPRGAEQPCVNQSGALPRAVDDHG